MKTIPTLNFDKSQHYILCTHREPDPDGAGALLALWNLITSLGIRSTPYLDACPVYMSFLPGYTELRSLPPVTSEQDFTLIALDCGHESRIWPLEMFHSAKTCWNIDHHADNPHFGHINRVDTTSSSTCELLFTMMQENAIPRNSSINTNLLSGMLFDTGGFRYPNTTAQTLQIATQLVAEGAPLADISERVFSRWSEKSYRALKLALDNLERPLAKEFLLSWIPYSAIREEGLSEIDFEGVVQVLREDLSAKIIILIREMNPNQFKASLRSKDDFSINDIALRFQGGGHRLAAGFSIKNLKAEDLRTKLLQEVQNKLR
ncbi:MAG TPA: DHHA1 domain-containing protein [Caldisericia bacterium]|nr:DHHA1 domain-containing protein [Caldisericia bacterium]